MAEIADWFVGGVSAAIGATALWQAIRPGERLFEFPKMRWLAQRYGQHTARTMLGVLGVILLVLGAVIAAGWKIHWSDNQAPAPAEVTTSTAALSGGQPALRFAASHAEPR